MEYPSFHACSARPAVVDACAHLAIRRYAPVPPLFMRALMPMLGPPMRTVFRGEHSPTEPLGRALEDQAVAGRDVQVFGEFPPLSIRR